MGCDHGDHQFINLEYCRVCTTCGIAEKRLCLDTFNLCSSPMVKNYSRKLRFKTKIDRMFFNHPKPQPTDPVWVFLQSCGTITCPREVRQALKNSKLVNKHYDNLKTICDCFTDFKIKKEDTIELHGFMVSQFNSIHSAWNFSQNLKFFSYTWLIRLFLTAVKSGYIAYLKPCTSKKRHIRYLRLLDTLMPKCSHLCDKIVNHVKSDIRLYCE